MCEEAIHRSASPMASSTDDPDEPAPAESDTEHLDTLDDGCGCTEVWEHLSEQRAAEAGDETE